MLDKIGVAFILAILFLAYALANPGGAAEVLIAALAGAGLLRGRRLLQVVAPPDYCPLTTPDRSRRWPVPARLSKV